MAISDYLQKLVELKNQLADNLNIKGVEATQDEKLNTLVPKVITIEQSTLGTGDYVVKFNSDNSIPSNAFRNCTSLISITIPDGVTSIGGCAFEGCSALPSITIPDSVTYIGASAFYDCSSLPSINIPDGVTSIVRYTFYGCTSLTSVIIPNSVTSIGENAFTSCTSLTSITIPDSVTSIDTNAFSNCKLLSDVYYKGTEEEWNSIQISFGNEYLTKSNIHYNYID